MKREKKPHYLFLLHSKTFLLVKVLIVLITTNHYHHQKLGKSYKNKFYSNFDKLKVSFHSKKKQRSLHLKILVCALNKRVSCQKHSFHSNKNLSLMVSLLLSSSLILSKDLHLHFSNKLIVLEEKLLFSPKTEHTKESETSFWRRVSE